jgi:G3E family GTPase
MSKPTELPRKARYIMIGGFLGAGKTTSVARLAEQLSRAGGRVGLITNDQGRELVDTAMLRAHGFQTEEIAGGCFCCRFNSLVEAAQRLSAGERPDVFIAEPVGSCTDLVATVSYPLRRMYGEEFSIAPLSVLVDPVRASRVLGLEAGGNFSEKVTYIYRKQMEEADLIVINKVDLLPPDRLQMLRERIGREFPQARILEVSARTGEGLAEWFQEISASDQTARVAMALDYDIYADGEALLGWLNGTITVSSERDGDANELLRQLAGSMQAALAAEQAEVAHLKMTLSPEEGLGGIAVINLVRNDVVPELSQELEDPVRRGQVIVNLRAEGAPERLRAALDQAIAACQQNSEWRLQLEHIEHFQPGRPQPTHRMSTGIDEIAGAGRP